MTAGDDIRVYADATPRWRRRIRDARRDPWGVVMRVVGDHGSPGLGGGPPLNWYYRKLETPYRRLWASAGDDGHGLSLTAQYQNGDGSWDDENCPVYSMSRDEMLFVFRFVAWGRLVDWFGLRRRVYYHALHKHLDATSAGWRP